MPWKCPACQTPIAHDPAVPKLEPQAIYRCHVCRLELVLERTTGDLALAPLEIHEPPPLRRFPL
jgi:hypothetical protein